MPQQTHCLKHKTKLEPDGVCHKCILERSSQSAKQFPAFATKIAKKKKKK